MNERNLLEIGAGGKLAASSGRRLAVKKVLGSALTVILLAAAPAVGQVQPQPTRPPAAAPKAADADQMICEKQEELGSRLSTHKVCHTRSQWEQMRFGDRSTIERVQTQRSIDQNGH